MVDFLLLKLIITLEMVKTLYINLEDDVNKVIAQLKREKSAEAVLVFPKQSFIFSDSINLRLLKKQVDMLGKKVSILTMDERGQTFAKEAGFDLKSMPRKSVSHSMSDIRFRTAPVPEVVVNASQNNFENDEIKEDITPEPIIIPAATQKKVIHRSAVKTSKNISRPNVRSISENSLPPVRTKENFFLPPDEKFVVPPKRQRSFKPYLVGFIALALIASLLLVLVVLPSANITIYAKAQTVARDIDIIADAGAQAPDSAKLSLPAVAVNESQTIVETFQTNGKKEVGSKAEGRIAIYNLTGSPMALKASTTTITVGSKVYLFKADQPTVKALTSASADSNATVADIIASDGGEGYNIPAGTRMEITNQAFGSQPQKLYAKTVTQIVGGNSRFISAISKDDITGAQTKLIKKVVDGINANLAGSNAKLVDGAYTVNVTSFSTDKPEGTEAQNFVSELKVTIAGLAFDETALKNIVRQRLMLTLGKGKTLQELEKDTIVYKIKNLDVQSGIMQLALHYESQAKPDIDEVDMKNKISGKTKQEALDLILSNPDIDKVEIVVQPAWQSGLPRFTSKIHIEVRE